MFDDMDREQRKDLETLGHAARRLLEKLDERRKASGSLEGPSKFDADGFRVMVEGTATEGETYPVMACSGSDRPLCRGDDVSQDRANAPPADIGNLHAAGERPGVRLSSGRRPAKLVAANDDRRSHYAPSPFREA